MTDIPTIQSFLDAIPMPAVYVGGDGRIVGTNSLARSMNPNALASRPFVLAFRQPALSEGIEACQSSNSAQKAYYHQNEGPNPVRYEVTISSADVSGERGVMLCFRDVTSLRQIDQMRRDFVANVSHELRSPLTAILGFIETLQGPARNDPDISDRFLGMMAGEADRMNRLVGDLLSLSKVEEDARRRPDTQEDMGDLIRSVMSNLKAFTQKSGGTVRFDAPETPVVIRADSDQMRQVFSNLIENALKYGGENTDVVVSVRDIERDPVLGRGAVAFDVVDNGVGIDPVHIPRLSERFYRIDSHRSREMGGTGLGLAIVKHILNRHRGRLKVVSALGQGSTFSVILPKD